MKAIKSLCLDSTFIISEEFENFELYSLKIDFNSQEWLFFEKTILKIQAILKGLEGYSNFFTSNFEIKISYFESHSVVINNILDLTIIQSEFNEIEDFDNENLSLKIVFYKNKKQINYIFNSQIFFDFITKLNYHESLKQWNFISEFDYIIFYFFDNDSEFNSKNIYFLNNNKTYPICNYISTIDRQEIFTKKNRITNTNFDLLLKIIPTDFEFNYKTNSKFNEYFINLSNILSIIFLADSTELNINSITYRIKGYKDLKEKCEFNDIQIKNNELILIYNWVYINGNIQDKIGLSRNIITLHCDNSLFNIESGTLNSILSNFEIYLKDNIKQYLEVKNKLSEFIINQTDKSVEVTKTMLTGLKTSLGTLLTFFISTFLIKIYNNSEIFSSSLYIISIILIVISFIYLFINIKEIESDKKHIINKFNIINERYKNILNANDLKKIMNSNLFIENTLTFIDERKKLYIILWVTLNIIFLIGCSLIFCIHNNISISN